jgi:3alpha(or 20beta)-hydroxysteroid dehydrogenase
VSGRLAGKVAIITGAAGGMGEREARRFVAEGARVVLTDVLGAELDRVAAELGDRARAVRHDVSSEADWTKVVETGVDAFGRVDVLVNNAAVHHLCTLEEETHERFQRLVAVNLGGTFLGIRAVIEPMRESGGGSIVNISSTAGLFGYFAQGAYSASKFGITGLTKVAAIELGASGIRVNSVHPGPIATAMLPTGPEFAGMFDEMPLARAGEPDEVAAMVVFLASDESSFVSGAQMVVDGGSTTGRAPAQGR